MRSGLRSLVLVGIAFAAGAVLVLGTGRWWQIFPPTKVSVQKTLEVLRRQQLAFLVTDRIVTQVLVEKRENSFWLGQSECFLIGVVRCYYGVDLSKLSGDALQRQGDAIVVTVPQPRELDLGVDLESVRVVSKRSGLIVIRDWVAGRDHRRELRGEFARTARIFLRRQNLIPSRETLVRRLQSYAPALSAKTGVKIVFR